MICSAVMPACIARRMEGFVIFAVIKFGYLVCGAVKSDRMLMCNGEEV